MELVLSVVAIRSNCAHDASKNHRLVHEEPRPPGRPLTWASRGPSQALRRELSLAKSPGLEVGCLSVWQHVQCKLRPRSLRQCCPEGVSVCAVAHRCLKSSQLIVLDVGAVFDFHF